MDCHVCGEYAGAACHYCRRAVCNRHGTTNKNRRWVCHVPDKLCREARSRSFRYAPYGVCPISECGLPMVKENDSPPNAPAQCPNHGYV
jgi:hypothetical protein